MAKTLEDFDVAGKRILARCDFNVPVDGQQNITDDYRIKQTIPTIRFLAEKGAKVILMSHMDPDSTGVADKKYSLKKIAEKISYYLGKEVKTAPDCVGQETKDMAFALQGGEVMLLENLRFYKEETGNDENFAKELAGLGEIYVNDSFGVDHRAHASVVGVPKFLPHCMGLLLEKEITSLDKVLNNSEKPMIGLVGGTKVGTKAKFIDRICESADVVIISGLIKKEIEEKNLQMKSPGKIMGPTGDLSGFDINEESIKFFSEKISRAKTVLWNGPFGKFEEEQYEKGTLAIAEAIIASGAFSVVGGGETVEFITKHGMLDKFSHVSTGGGAMLNYLAGDELPGLAALK